jgi:hypothetical protein
MENKQVLIKSFTKEINARIASACLESQGIQAYIKKDDCGGNYPQLQVSPGVQLFVDAEDEQAAITILNDSETEEVSKQEPSIKKSKSNALFFIVIFLLGIGLGYLLNLKLGEFQKKDSAVFENDTNGDNKSDIFSYYKKDILLRQEADRNYDGRIDVWYHYKNNNLASAEFDDNFDNKIDGWAKYRDENNLDLKIDTDFNGKPDATIYMVNQLKVKVDWYPNESSILQKREIYEHGNKKEELIDTDVDGKFDLKIIYDAFGNETHRINLKK